VPALSGVMSPRPGDRGDSRLLDDEVKERRSREEGEAAVVGMRRRTSMLTSARVVVWLLAVIPEKRSSFELVRQTRSRVSP
jgi:hypothetical protein